MVCSSALKSCPAAFVGTAGSRASPMPPTSLPHRGPIEIIKDKWQDKQVLYYIERTWAPHVKTIFGNTPRMIEYFSRILGVPFPWPKYGQVIVREFVSGRYGKYHCRRSW
jgi:hypothetical protein